MADDFSTGVASVKVEGRFTAEQVVAIRLAFARGWKSANQMGRQYGVSAATIHQVVQGSTYKAAGGIITWPEHRKPKKDWTVRGWCKSADCKNQVADSGWAQRMHLCISCFKRDGGKKCGRVPRGVVKTLKCRVCGVKFPYYVKKSAYRPKCCSHKCGYIFAGRNKSGRPKDLTTEKLNELYWGQNKTAPEIAALYANKFHWSSVILWMRQDGLLRRVSNWRTYTHCIVDGCGEPRFVLRQHKTGRPYGRLCHQHHNERETQSSRMYLKHKAERRGQLLVVQIEKFLVGLPDSVKTDALQEITLAVLCGTLPLPLTQESIKPYIAQMFRENADAYKFLSLAAPTRDEEGAQTWGERLGLC